MFKLFMALIFALTPLILFPKLSIGAEETFAYQSYRDIPGVTKEEIEAIERIIKQKPRFILGAEPSVELFRQIDGSLGGYNVLLCNWLSSLFGAKFTPVIYDWDLLTAGLDRQDIDFTGDLTPTPERVARYFMTSPMLERPIKYMRLPDSLSLAEIAKSRPPRYGFLAKTSTFDQVSASLEKSYAVIMVDNHKEAYQKLLNGDIDAFVDEAPYEAAFDSFGDIVTEDMLPMVFGPVSLATANPEFEPIIKVVQKALDNGGVEYLTILLKRGQAEYRSHKFFSWLTPEERQYVFEHSASGQNKPIPVGLEYDNYPIAFYNDREKAWQGCAWDVLEEIRAISGLNFANAFPEPVIFPEMVRKLESGEIAVISELIKTTEREGRFIWPDKPFTTDNYALVSLIDFPNIELSDVRRYTIGLSEGTAYTELFWTLFPRHTRTKEYIDVLLPLYALERGEVDLVMSTQNQLLSMTNFLEKPYFKINVFLNRTYESYFGINKSETILRSIISKGMKLINVNNIAEQWKRRVFDYNSAVARERTPFLVAGIFLFLCVIVLLLIMYFKGKSTEKYLESLVETRTRELKRQTEVANLAAKAKTEFLARTSHEIRTPMNAILGLSELAQREYGQPKALEYIIGIKNAGKILLSIINDILDFSKIESGGLLIHPESYQTASLLNDALAVIRVRMTETALNLFLTISPNIPANLIGDSVRIKQILLNLLSNAVKYTNQGFIKFTAKGEPIDPKAIRLTFVVEDSGVGVKPEDLAKLFVEFTRVDDSNSSRIEGTGLGLVIARSLCRAMGGDITVESQYGRGSTFTATLIQNVDDWAPMGDLSTITETRAETQIVTFTAPEAELLIVDDFPSNLLVAEGLLVPYGARVLTCLNGREAVELVQRRPFDLVLMDHMMPEMDGVAATLAIRAMSEERCQTMPIIALTANAVSGMKELFLENGFNDFISKPIDTVKLDEVLKRWIPASKRRKIARPEPQEPAPKAPKAPNGSEELPRIPGVKAAAGLARLGGNRRLYLKLLGMFRQDLTTGFIYLENPPTETTLADFTTKVHAFKSGLANIGAEELSKSAALLESAGRKADWPTINERLPGFREEIALLSARIGAFLGRTEEAKAKTPKAQMEPEIGRALERLKETLKAQDLTAIEVALTQLQALPLNVKTREVVSTIEERILTADYQIALNDVISLQNKGNYYE
ncbi:MAG: transporter substrate-binding domain-containing protein [Deltaproteobacteria bacterium]|nr:transporter substrate-binding domain-containing protein [Deltaproteobacteria bacterium]